MPDEKIREVFQKLENLPTLPQIATKLLTMAVSDTSDFEDVVKIIESDPSLSSRILRLVNSSSMGIPTEIRTIKRAAVILGFEGLRSHILCIHAFDVFAKNLKRHQWDRKGLWRHSLAVACTAELIAEKTRTHDPAEAFVAGLLHDIGIMALDYCLGEGKYREVMELMDKEHISILEAEKRTLGVDHTLSGKWVAEKWNLPKFILSSIWLHHQAATTLMLDNEVRNLTLIVHLANTICSQHRFGFEDSGPELISIDDQCEGLGLTKEKYEQVLSLIGKYVEERAKILGLDLDEKKLYFEALQSANLAQGRFLEKLDCQNRTLRRNLKEFLIIHTLGEKLAPDSSLSDVLENGARCAMDFFGAEKIICYIVDRERQYLLGKVSLKGEEKAETIYVSLGKNKEANVKILNGDKIILQELVAELSAQERKSSDFADVPTAGRIALFPLKISANVAGGIFVDNRNSRVELVWQTEEVLALASALSAALARASLVHELKATCERLAESNREIEAANLKLLQSRKLAAIGRMAAGAAHEMNNPLAIISGRAQLLLKKERSKEAQEQLTIITTQCDRLSKIISDLLGFARPAKPDIRKGDLNEAIKAALDDLKEKTGVRPINIIKNLQKDLPKGAFDKSQMVQVFTNIIKNAIEAIQAKGAIEISSLAAARQPMLIVKISDTGEGIAAENLDKIFDPFFTTKQPGRGTGLGLSIAYSIIEAHKGKIYVESALGKGSAFTIYIPMASDDTPESDDIKDENN